MATVGNAIRTGIAAALLLSGLTPSARGFVPGAGGVGFGVGGRGMVKITGTIVCAGCSVEEARQAQPDALHLYQLLHRQGQVVLDVKTVNGSGVWDLPWPARLTVRAKDSVFQQLAAEAHLRKAVEITGLLSTTRTLDIATVSLSG